MKEYYCEVCGRKHSGKHSSHYCRKHQWQIEKFGKPLDCNPRNKFDANEFRFKGDDIVEFDTYKEQTCEIDKTFTIDASDYPIVSKYKWSTYNGKYASTDNGKILLHRLVMNAKKGQQIDHINLNTLDNRKANLRVCNNSLNSSNRNPYNKLSIKGVEYHKSINKYSAYFRINDKQYHSKCYRTKEEASFARFILEQMFRKESLTQHSTDLVQTLSVEQKSKIIDDIKKKFNKE